MHFRLPELKLPLPKATQLTRLEKQKRKDQAPLLAITARSVRGYELEQVQSWRVERKSLKQVLKVKTYTEKRIKYPNMESKENSEGIKTIASDSQATQESNQTRISKSELDASSQDQNPSQEQALQAQADESAVETTAPDPTASVSNTTEPVSHDQV
jgi:hypothetical protein